MNGVNLSLKNNFTIKAVLLFSLTAIALYLLTEHRAQLLAYSSYIVLLVYVLLHTPVCGSHGKHGEHRGHGGCGGHDHGKHKHNEQEKETPNTGAHEDAGQLEHIQEKFT